MGIKTSFEIITSFVFLFSEHKTKIFTVDLSCAHCTTYAPLHYLDLAFHNDLEFVDEVYAVG